MQQPDFWNDHEYAAQVSQKVSQLKEELASIKTIQKELSDIKELSALSTDDVNELQLLCDKLIKKVEKEEFKTFLSGPYDANDAILEIFSGVGGQDAGDWATMLLRMYQRYCSKKGFVSEIIHQSFGDPGGPEGRIGTKNVTLEVKGPYAYGFLKKEQGVHRLVRISPFNAQKLRQTSFALVEVLPEIREDESEMEIPVSDIRLETFKSSGPGGQYVNKTESAVRIIHIPTGITVACQTERMQGKNRQRAMKILYAKLHQLRQQEQKKELRDIKGGAISASWGNQIRSYVLHPYQMVKDLRTQYETSDTQGVLDGDLDEFIEAEVKM